MSDNISKILVELEKNGWKVSTDTRKEISGSVYFALKGENFDGSQFVKEALDKGAVAAVTEDALETLQKVAKIYREKFNIPIIAIGGSNGKTTSKELVSEVLKTKYKIHATPENLNNHIGVPLSILAMKMDSEIGVFEIGANHPGEHTELLNILAPTVVVVTNNGMDHLEGFGSPEGVRKANKELYDYARESGAEAFVNKNNLELLEDSALIENRFLYPEEDKEIITATPLAIRFNSKAYVTHLAGHYNLENIELALSIGKHFHIDTEESIKAICQYKPSSKRSEILEKNGNTFIVDCYNANPSSMMLSLESFIKSTKSPRGVALGDMLELGTYSDAEHEKIVKYLEKQNLDTVIFIGPHFKKALETSSLKYQWFEDSATAGKWFKAQNFQKFTFLLKGSRGMKVERIIE